MRPLAPPTCRGASLDWLRGRLEPGLERGRRLSGAGRVVDASCAYRAAADARPADMTAVQLAAFGCLDADEWEDALRYARAALPWTAGRSPLMQIVTVHALLALGRHAEAFQTALALHRGEPENEEYHYLLAEICRDQGDRAGYRRWAERGLALPGESLTRNPIRLWLGEWDAVRAMQTRAPSASGAKEWDGTATAGTVLVTSRARGRGGPGLWAGHGDIMMFSQVVASAAQRVGRLVLDVPGPLLELFRWTFRAIPNVECAHAPLLPPGSVAGLPAHDLHVAYTGLAALAGPPSGEPYLEAPPGPDPDLGAGRHIGIAWGASDGDPGHVGARSAPLAALAPPLLALDGIVLHSLQVGPAERELGAFPEIRRHTFHDFADTARLARALDAVVSVDAACHLAAGVGTPTMVLLAVAADWRWGVGETTDWWRAITLLRQPRPGDWHAVAQRAAQLIAGGALFASARAA